MTTPAQPLETPSPVSRAQPGDDLEGGLSISPSEVLDRLWRFFISMRTGLALILLLAGLGLIGTLLMQAQPGLASDPQSYAAWLNSLRPKYGGWTGVLDRLGFLSIFSSPLFKGTMALLITSIVACAVNRTPLLWRQATRPRVKVTQAFLERAPLHAAVAVRGDPEAALAPVLSAFGSRRFRTTVTRDDEGIHVYADRFRWGPFGSVIAHLSLVLVLAGVLVGSAFGFRNTEFPASIGSKVDVGYGTGLSLVATSFTDTYSLENGAPSDYASDLVVYRGDEQVAAQRIHVNEPLRVGDITFYQSFYGPAAEMRVKDASGSVIYSAGVPLLWGSKDETERVGQFDLPTQGLQVFVVSAASGKVSPTIKPGQAQVELYKAGSGTPVDLKVIDQGKPATIGGLEVTFEREHQFTGLIVAKDPGVPFVWGGSLLLVLGVCLVFFFPYRRAWASLTPRDDGTTLARVGAVVGHDAAFGTDFAAIVDDLRRVPPTGLWFGKGVTS